MTSLAGSEGRALERPLCEEPCAGGLEIHASCAVRDAAGVLLLGPPGAGKSDLLLRLLDGGFQLVADDRVIIEAGVARAPDAARGLLEIGGVGVVSLSFVPTARLELAVMLDHFADERLPRPLSRVLGLPVIRVNPWHASAVVRIRMAADTVLERVRLVVGFSVD